MTKTSYSATVKNRKTGIRRAVKLNLRRIEKLEFDRGVSYCCGPCHCITDAYDGECPHGWISEFEAACQIMGV